MSVQALTSMSAVSRDVLGIRSDNDMACNGLSCESWWSEQVETLVIGGLFYSAHVMD